MERISSRQNPMVRRFRALIEPSPDYVLLDGPHLLEEALASQVPVEVVALADSAGGGAIGTLAQRAERAGARLVNVTESVLGAMSPVRQPSGVVTIARRRDASLEAALGHPPQLVMMLADVQDPGNVGAIIRTAEACGATGIITSERSADPFGWKALRGSMGSVFRIPIAPKQSLAAAIAEARRRSIRVYTAVPQGGRALPDCDLREPSGIVLGGEGAGVSPETVALADQTLSIPMRAPVESLNVATAAAIIAYEAQRQRHGGAR
jgi:RNA methyltransferase, TrmH family